MEVTALCFRLLMLEVILLRAHVQTNCTQAMANTISDPSTPPHEGPLTEGPESLEVFILLSVAVTILSVILVLLVIGFLNIRKHRANTISDPSTPPHEGPLTEGPKSLEVFILLSVAVTILTVILVLLVIGLINIRKHRELVKEQIAASSSASALSHSTPILDSTANEGRALSGQKVLYSSIVYKISAGVQFTSDNCQKGRMEVTAHRFRLVILLIILLRGRVHTSAFHIVPNKLQLFQYESVSFHCEGLDGSAQLRGIRNTEGFLSVCDSNKTIMLFCTIDRAYQADSGEYWCETKGGKRSNNVSITVTAGSVVLDSPVLPVIEGDNVTLRCSNKNLSSLTAYFYKDERLIRTSITGNMTIHSVSRSHEGFYKCASGAEESPVNPLTVRAHHRDACPCSDPLLCVVLLIRIVFTIVMVPLLLLLVGLLYCGKRGAPQSISQINAHIKNTGDS
ncbi:hypothetical protein Q8A73_012681 [Channa argus]|nr:hypothetical protein Q8A73_012681 [Channa argus]